MPGAAGGDTLTGIAAVITAVGGLILGVAAVLTAIWGRSRSRRRRRESAPPDDELERDRLWLELLEQLEAANERAADLDRRLEECNAERLALLRQQRR